MISNNSSKIGANIKDEIVNNTANNSNNNNNDNRNINAPSTSFTSPQSSHLDKRKQHNCPFCDRAFTRPYRLNDHISFSHTDEVSIYTIKKFYSSNFRNLKTIIFKRENTCVRCVLKTSPVKINLSII